MPQPRKFRTKRGLLTPYAFACGYVERYRNGVKIIMQHGCYLIGRHPEFGAASDGTRSVTKAREIARKLSKEAVCQQT